MATASAVKKVQLPPFSMFAKTPIYSVNGVIVPGLMQPVILPATGDSIYTVTLPAANRLDKISNFFYNTPLLWWAIAQVNNLVDPFLDIPVGTQLRIPQRSRLPVS
jgi:nucleoid-associated protein YgaU